MLIVYLLEKKKKLLKLVVALYPSQASCFLITETLGLALNCGKSTFQPQLTGSAYGDGGP